MTMEETTESHLTNMESLGIDLDIDLQVSDLTELREIDNLLNEEMVAAISLLKALIPKLTHRQFRGALKTDICLGVGISQMISDLTRA